MDISFQETGVVKQKEDIIIRRGIVHILDATLGYPVYSEQELDLTPDINDFFRSHIFKLMSGDDMKKCYFPEEEDSPVYDIVKEFSEDDLVADSKRLTDELYRIMNANVAIPSADLAIVCSKSLVIIPDLLPLLLNNFMIICCCHVISS